MPQSSPIDVVFLLSPFFPLRHIYLQFIARYFYNVSAELRRTRNVRESNSSCPGPWRLGRAFSPTFSRRGYAMADQTSPFQFEDISLEEARRMGRGPRMEPMLYETLRQKIQTLSSEAVRIRLGPEITPTRMKNYLLHIARELNVPITIRRVPGGLIFWRSSDEDLQQAKEVGGRLKSAQRARQVPEGRGRRRTK
jgi:hypothetical protein